MSTSCRRLGRWVAAAALLAAAAAAAGGGLAASESPLTIQVTLDGGGVALTVPAGHSFQQASEAFCVQHSISVDNAPKLVRALEQAYHKRTGGTPADREPSKEQPAAREQAVADDGSQAPLGAVQVVVFVDTGSGTTYPLVVREGQTPDAAAVAFLQDHGLPVSNAPALVAAVDRKLANRIANPPVLSLPVTVDGLEHMVHLHDNEDPVTAAREFMIVHGLTAHVKAGDFQAGIVSVLEDAAAKAAAAAEAAAAAAAASAAADAAAQLSAEAQRREQAAAAAAAQAAMDANRQAELAEEAAEAEVKEMRLTVAGVMYELEYPVGAAADALADAFCEQEFALLQDQLGEQYKLESVTMRECVSVVTTLMQPLLE